MRDIAQTAGVSVETVYKHFPTKAALLARCVDEAVAGGAEDVALADRPFMAEISRGRSRRERANVAGTIAAATIARVCDLDLALREGAASDNSLKELRAKSVADSRESTRQILELVVRRPVDDATVDGIWAITRADVYALLIRDRGWTDAQYREWLIATVTRLLT